MAELNINTIFPYNGKLYKVIRSNNNHCNTCGANFHTDFCYQLQAISNCFANRKDGNFISFLEIAPYYAYLPVGAYRPINDMQVTAIENDSCSNCVFCNVCAKNNTNNTITTFEVNKYFGECKSINRCDMKNVTFRIRGKNTFADSDTIDEIYKRVTNYKSTIKEINKNNSTSDALLRGVNSKDIKDVVIPIPDGYYYKADVEDNNLVIKFYKKYLDYGDIINHLGDRAIQYDGNNEVISNTIKLINIIHYYNIYFKAKEPKKCIIKKGENVYIINCNNVPKHSPFILLSKDAADEIISNPEFKDILDKVSTYNIL